MLEIRVITKGVGDFEARIAGKSSYRECGFTPTEAIGNLIRRFPKQFDIEITYRNPEEE